MMIDNKYVREKKKKQEVIEQTIERVRDLLRDQSKPVLIEYDRTLSEPPYKENYDGYRWQLVTLRYMPNIDTLTGTIESVTHYSLKQHLRSDLSGYIEGSIDRMDSKKRVRLSLDNLECLNDTTPIIYFARKVESKLKLQYKTADGKNQNEKHDKNKRQDCPPRSNIKERRS